MCTLFVAWNQHPRYPLIVAANRDEQLGRPSSPPRVWPGEIPFVAPVDEQAGGSWVGLNARGVFTAITNRYLTTRYPERRSRGEIVTEVLRLPSADAIWKRMQRLDPRGYNAFHLLYADADRAFVSWTDGEKITHEELAPGLHVVTERSYADEPPSRAERLRRQWSGLSDVTDPEQLFGLLKLHAADNEDPFSGTCIHAPAFNYGTRSSTVLKLGGDDMRYFASEGPAHSGKLFEVPLAPLGR